MEKAYSYRFYPTSEQETLTALSTGEKVKVPDTSALEGVIVDHYWQLGEQSEKQRVRYPKTNQLFGHPSLVCSLCQPLPPCSSFPCLPSVCSGKVF
ncbi:helix-turn-helix domain-containing protein [Thermostichus vulcanus]|uniref:Helix-turn-helix domain-containing protein n=1 Tax=Thermostichus vulcanus str. 'Rupite' TaxID=2813851 RepID=A0ABT0C6G4_THEVL|nr:helix-turn-helix domain-containing protein [Thermostichus vulcanus str. 'Rupite']